MKHLRGFLINPAELSKQEEDQMLVLMADHYDGVSETHFRKDLRDKRWVILLRDEASREISGFSTYTLLDERIIDGVRTRAIFSGDTIIKRSHWGCWELFKLFGRLSYSLHTAFKKDGVTLYWHLISKGYKTYRLLPGFFKKFYPCCDEETPFFEKKVLESCAQQKYPSEFDCRTGVIHFSEPRDRLKDGVADVSEKLLKDKHIDFFCRANPYHSQGDELACIAEFSPGNLRPAALKMIFG